MTRTNGYDHVVLVSLDNLRSDCIGLNPFRLWPRLYPALRRPDTRVLDDFVGQGAFFLNTIAAAPYTAASHGTYLTGRFPLHNGLYEFYGGRLSGPTIFTYARRQGRATVASVDFPIILGPELGFTADVDRYLVEDDDGFIDAVTGAPRALGFVHFGGIHVPYGFHKLRFGGDAYRDMVARLESELPPELPFHLDELTETYRDAEDRMLFLRYKRAVHHFYETGAYARLFDLYLRGLEHFLRTRFQRFLSRLRERLDAGGGRWLIVLFGDHGHEFSPGSFGNFNSFSEGVLRVPVVFVGDGIEPQVRPERIRSADVVPTLLELMGMEPLAGHPLDGRSLAPVLWGGGAPDPNPVAFVQAYTADANDFVAYQKRQLAGGTPEPLRHVMLGEVVYSGDRRVLRELHRYSPGFDRIDALPGTPVVERFDASLVPRPDPEHDPSAELALLDAYDAGRRPAATVPADDATRIGLRNMGYQV